MKLKLKLNLIQRPLHPAKVSSSSQGETILEVEVEFG